MGCTPSKPSKPPQKQISRPIHPQPTTKNSIHPTTRRTLYQSSHHVPRPASEKARMNTKPLPLLPSKAELRSKGQLDSHGKIIMNPHPTWNGKKTMPRPYPGQAIKRKPVPAPAKPAIPVKAPGYAGRAMHVQQQQQQQQQRKAVPAPANRSAQVPREIKRVAANHHHHHQQHVAFLDGKWVGPDDGKNAFTGFKGGYMVQRYDGKWVPAKEVMRGKGGKEREVVHAGGWF